MAARARRQFLEDLGRDVEPASQGPPQADQGRLRSVGQARCRSQGPRLPHGECGGGNYRERSPREKSDRDTQGEIARPARPNVYPDGSPAAQTAGRPALSPDGRCPGHYSDSRGARPGKEHRSRREDVDRRELASVLIARKERQMNTEHATPEVVRLELVYLPSPYKEEKVNFTVSIGGQ